MASGWVGGQPAVATEGSWGGSLCVHDGCPQPTLPLHPPAVPAACPLPTPKGSMEGHFEFYARDADSGQWRKSFLVKIGQFALRAD